MMPLIYMYPSFVANFKQYGYIPKMSTLCISKILYCSGNRSDCCVDRHSCTAVPIEDQLPLKNSIVSVRIGISFVYQCDSCD